MHAYMYTYIYIYIYIYVICVNLASLRDFDETFHNRCKGGQTHSRARRASPSTGSLRAGYYTLHLIHLYMYVYM